ncbi:MAG: hypothetical protein FD176_2919 [Rhodospirillaceae bacterium]|nr:MAG: hypothetical protein FD176_2919 [Rhodospirillaceae bacterium]TNC95306.1 MAG: Uncharacterized protein FD119_2430 [Stygiobacter sp.]
MKALRIHWNQAETWAGHHDAVQGSGQTEADGDEALDQVFARIAAALPERFKRRECRQRGGPVEAASSDTVLLFRWLKDH